MLNFNNLLSGAGPLIAILIVAAVVFSESGLLIGFFLPGDTLLFGAGLLAADGKINLLFLILATFLAAVLGDNVGYSIGQRAGPKLFTKDDSILFRREYIERARNFYEKHGGKAIVIARFTPIVRTFAPVVAGVGEMSRARFTFYNVIGGALWAIIMPSLGFFLGKRIPGLDNYIEYVLIGVVVASIGLSALHILKDKKTRQQISKKFTRRFKNRA